MPDHVKRGVGRRAKRITTAVLILMSAQAWSEDPQPTPILSNEREALFNEHVGNLAKAIFAIQADLKLSIPDQRVLLHLPHRGFPNLAALVKYPPTTNFFGAMFPGRFTEYAIRFGVRMASALESRGIPSGI